MEIEAAFDILNDTNPALDLWTDAYDFLQEHGLSWSFSWASERFFLVDIATQWSTDIPDDYQVEPIGPVEQLHFDWVACEVWSQQSSGLPTIDTCFSYANISNTSLPCTMPSSKARREDRSTMAVYHGKPYDPDGLCQDDYEWLTETDPYANTRVAIIRRGLTKRRETVLTARKSTSCSLLQAYQQSPQSVTVPALEAVKEALTMRLCTLNFRLALLDAYPHAGYYHLRACEVHPCR